MERFTLCGSLLQPARQLATAPSASALLTVTVMFLVYRLVAVLSLTPFYYSRIADQIPSAYA